MVVLRVHLLGEFRLTYEDLPLDTVNTARMQSLLAYLLLHRDAPQRRQHLAFLFWPDTNEPQALTNLRTLLHRLRRALPAADRFLHTDSQTVHWQADAACTLDVAEFEAALALAKSTSNLEQALQFYRGDLLPSCYDDWISPLREQLRQRALGALTRLTEMLIEERRYQEAITYSRRWLQLDPLNEATYRQLMHLHAAAGDRAGALRVYQLCELTLRQELDAEPAKATRELYQRLRSAPDEPSFPARGDAAGPALVGRQAEWKLLLDTWYAVAAGKSGCVVVSGEAGIGKTRLADELLGWVNRQGFATAAAQCYAVEGDLSYAPLATWLRSARLRPRWATLDAVWLAELARLLPEIQAEHPDLPRPGPLSEGWQRLRLFAALARALLKPGAASLFLIDDLQWCDAETLAWLHYALHTSTQAPLLLLGTMRTEEMDVGRFLADWLAALQRSGQMAEVALGPLNAGETASLATQVAGRLLTTDELDQLYRETEGNPLFVVESVRAELAFGQKSTGGGEAQRAFAGRSLPPKVQTVIQTRLARLSSATRDLAGLAAAIGRSFSIDVLAEAARLDEESLVRCLGELAQQRIVHERDAHAYDFTHDKLREVAYNRLSAAQRRLHHRRIAGAYEVVYRQFVDSVSGQIATHYELAGALEQAIPYYQRASDAARRVYANAEAIQYCRRALALLEGSSASVSALATVLHERLGDLLLLTGEYEGSRNGFQRALTALPERDCATRARLKCKMGNAWREQYAYKEALRAYELALQTLGETNTGTDSASVAAWWQERIQITLEVLQVYYWLGRVRDAEESLPQLRAAVAQHGTPDQRVSYAKTVVWQEFRRNRSVATTETVAALRSALAAHLESGHQDSVPAAQFQLGFVLLWSGDPEGAIPLMQAALRLAGQTDDITLQTRCLAYLAVAFRQCNQVDETRRHALRALEAATTAKMPEYAGIAMANQAWIAWRAGDVAQTQEAGHAALQLWARLPTGHASAPFQWLALLPLLAAALREGRFAVAIDHARALLDPAQQRMPHALSAALEQAVGAWDTNHRVTAHAFLRQAENVAQQMHHL